jgi:RHS repeat-associated protein
MLLSVRSFGARRLVSLLLVLAYIFQPISAFAGVSLITGRFSYETVDLATGMSGNAPIRLTRYYESPVGNPTPVPDGPFGKGTHMGLWSLTAQKIDNTRYRLYMPTGEVTYFTNANTGDPTVYKNEEQDDSLKGTLKIIGYNSAQLTQEDGTFLDFGFLLTDGVTHRLSQIRDRFGNGYNLTWCATYTTTCNGASLLNVDSTTKQGIELYYGTGNLVSGASVYSTVSGTKAYVGSAVSYFYDGNGNLQYFYSTINQKDVQTISSDGTIGSRRANGITTYGYDGYTLTTVTNPRGITSLVNTYDNNKVTKQKMPGTSSSDSNDDLLTSYTYGSGVTSMAMLVGQISKMQINHNYNSNNYVTSVTDLADNSTTSYVFDETKRHLDKVTNALGYFTSFTYSNNEHIDKITEFDPSVVTDYDFNAPFGQLFVFTDPKGNVTTNSYDENGGKYTLASTSNQLPSSESYNYDQYTGLPKYIIDGMGRRSDYTFSGLTKALLYDSNPVANNATTLTRAYAYDGLLRVTETYLTSVPTDLTAYTYDQLNRVTSVTNPGSRRTFYAYDDSGNITAVRAPNGVVTSYTYDAMDRVASRTNSTYTETYTYNSLGQLYQKRDPKGQYTTYAYDDKGRLLTVTYADASFLTYAYDKLNRITSITDSSGGDKNVAFTYFNENSNIIGPKSVTTGTGATADTLIYTYDKVGNLLKISRQVSNAAFVSQSLQNGQPIPTPMTAGQTYTVQVKMQNTGNSTWTSTAGYKLGSQNPQDNNTWGVSRVALASATAPGAIATFNFTITAPLSAGTYNLQWKMLQEGVQWFGAPSTNIVIGVSVPASPLPTITSFNPTSNYVDYPVTLTGSNFSGATSVSFISSTGTSTATSFTVDSNSQITANVPNVVVNADYTIKVCTAAVCNTSASTFRVLKSVTCTRNCVPDAPNPQPSSVSGGGYPDLLIYSYNADNSLKAASLVGHNGQADIQVGFSYNNAAELTNFNIGYTDVDIASNIKVYGSVLYSDQGDVAQLYYGTTQGGGDLRYVQYAYDYNYKGFLSNRSEIGQSVVAIASNQAYSYNSVGELTGANTPTFAFSDTYDSDGNPTQISDQCCGSASPAYEPGTNRMTSAYGWAIVNDANGNQTKTTIPACPAPETQTWNARDQLTAYNSGCLGYGATFTYDALGRRLTKTVNGVTTKFIYSGNQVIEEITNGVTKRYLVGLGLDDVWASRQGSVDEFLLKDALNGSVMAVVDPTTQTVKTGYGYSPFGTTYKSNNNSNNNLLFTGRELDLGGTVYYFRARYYNAGFQRFLSEDPIGFAGGDTNLYSYGNSPLIGGDPTGLCPIESNCGGSGGGGFDPAGLIGGLIGGLISTILNIFGGIPNKAFQYPGNGPNNPGVPNFKVDARAINSQYVCSKYSFADCSAVDYQQNVYKSENGPSGGKPALRGDDYSPEVVNGRIEGGRSYRANNLTPLEQQVSRRVGTRNIEIIRNLGIKVTEFISRYRKASITREFPGELLGDTTVEEAIASDRTKVIKLLTDGRFSK